MPDSQQPAPAEIMKIRANTAAAAAGHQREVTFLAELQAHDVALWMVDDLIEALRNDIDPYEFNNYRAIGRSDQSSRRVENTTDCDSNQNNVTPFDQTYFDVKSFLT